MATEYVANHLDRVASTQDEARSRYAGLPRLVTAAFQEQGRGRSGSTWLNAPRALAASLAFPVAWPAETIPLLTLIAGMAARGVLNEELRFKWPNDLVQESGGKVAGLLAEMSGELVVIGLGANLYWPEPPLGMAALASADPGAATAPRIAERWAELLLAGVASGPELWDRDGYRVNCVTLGTDVTWDGGGKGRAVDIDEAGGLIVETPGGLTTLRSGRVSEVRPATVDGKGAQ
ncbi:MAG: hypothetical protein V3V82_03005 [Acidimicrobiia bacterium]